MVGDLVIQEVDHLGGVGIAPGIGSNPILDIVLEHAPRLYKTTTNPRSRYMMSCPLPGHHDAEHTDHSGSFSVNDAGNLFYCFGCGASGNAETLRQNLAPGAYAGTIPTAPLSKPEVAVAGSSKSQSQTVTSFQGVTISQLASAKGLDLDHVVEELGWQDVEYRGTPAICIPYWNETRSHFQARYRVGLDRGDRFLWKKGAKACLYGLWELELIKKRGFVVLVEGESDYAVLDYRGFPVLAVPGASNFKAEWVSTLAGIRDIYAWKEPDQGGDTFIKVLSQKIPRLKVITPPAGIKDPADMSVKMGDGFADEMNDLIDMAKPSEVGTTGICGANFTDIRQAVASAYQHGGNHDAALKVERCALWRRGYRYECGEIEGRTFHCGKRGCPNCTMVSLTHLFDEKQVVVAQIVTPYIVHVPVVHETDVVGLSREEMASEFNRGIGITRKLLSDWTKHEGKKCDLARHHIYSIQCKIDLDGVARFGGVIFGDEPVTPIRHWLERRLGLAVRVNEEINLTLPDAINRFKYLTVTGFTWSNHDQFLAWCDSQKQKKLVQGKGRFSGVSGSKGSSRVPETAAICPTHGVEEQVIRLQQIGPPDAWKPVKSPLTNRIHYLLRVPFSNLITDDG